VFHGRWEFSWDRLGSLGKSKMRQRAKSRCASDEISKNKTEHMDFTLTLQLCFLGVQKVSRNFQ
jgi:hypothetical protein